MAAIVFYHVARQVLYRHPMVNFLVRPFQDSPMGFNSVGGIASVVRNVLAALMGNSDMRKREIAASSSFVFIILGLIYQRQQRRFR